MVLDRRLAAGWLFANLASLASGALISRAMSLPASVQLLAKAPNAEPGVVRLSLGLSLQNVDGLEEMLREVSDPESRRYGKYLSTDQIMHLFGPAPESYDKVTNWLRQQGVKDMTVSPDGLSINFAATVEQANKMLNADFRWYDVKGVNKLRTREYSIMDDISTYIDVVSPTNYFGVGEPPAEKLRMPEPHIEPLVPASTKNSVEARQDSPCSRLITPDCLKELYDFNGHRTDPASGSRIGFASFLNQSAVPSDLDKFLQMFDLPPTDWESVIINSGSDHRDYRRGVQEGNLDAQMMAVGGQDLPMTHFITGGSPPFVPNLRLDEDSNTNEPYMEFYQHLMSKENEEIPQVISISYGDDEQTVPRDYAVRTCNFIGLMGLRGVSVIEASGDGGVGAPCRANDGSGKIQFTPQFPPSCPWITAVGGTQGWLPELAWFGSGGGFSNYFEQPWYQKDKIAEYFAENMDEDTRDEYMQYANYSGRGFPDIAAHSMSPHYQIMIGGASAFSGGTSAAAPLVAGLIGMINAERLKAGKPTLGFLNPFLYSLEGRGLNDITGGASKGCDGYDTQTGAPVEGAGKIGERGAHWNATKGWDPATGLGTPNFKWLLKQAMRYPKD